MIIPYYKSCLYTRCRSTLEVVGYIVAWAVDLQESLVVLRVLIRPDRQSINVDILFCLTFLGHKYIFSKEDLRKPQRLNEVAPLARLLIGMVSLYPRPLIERLSS